MLFSDTLLRLSFFCFFFFFNDTATTEIYTLSLHDALPIYIPGQLDHRLPSACRSSRRRQSRAPECRSEEHTSELQSRSDLVCRLLLEKKKVTGKFTTVAKIQQSCKS